MEATGEPTSARNWSARPARAAGLLDPARTRPSATYPCDLFFGRSFNCFLDHHLDINAGWFPPARWTDQP